MAIEKNFHFTLWTAVSIQNVNLKYHNFSTFEKDKYAKPYHILSRYPKWNSLSFILFENAVDFPQ